MEIKVKLYKFKIRPMMTYASSSWGYAANFHTQNLEVVQNQVHSHALSASQYVHRDLEMSSIAEFIRDRAINTVASLEEQPLISSKEDNYDEDKERKHKRPKVMLRILLGNKKFKIYCNF